MTTPRCTPLINWLSWLPNDWQYRLTPEILLACGYGGGEGLHA